MNPEERREKHARQTDVLYAAIGRFVVKFEHVCHTMSTGMTLLLQKKGLSSQRISNAILSGLTATPLQKMYSAVVAETLGDRLTKDEERILSGVMNRVSNLIKSRNDTIHRTWFVGWASAADEDFSRVDGVKNRNTKRGVEFSELNYSAADFDKLSQEADYVAQLVARIYGCLLLEKKLSDNFVLRPDGMIELPPKT